MKVYLRHVKTGMYYSGWHNWTSDNTRAVKFETPQEALQRARSEMMTQMEIVIHDGNPVTEKVVPIVEQRK
jgi:hypothetical protein